MKRFLIILLFIPALAFSQEEKEKKFGVKFSGFIKSDLYFDSRQTVDARLGHFMLYPKNEDLDENGEDINANPKLNFLSIQTRLTLKITGPDALGAKTSGLIEGAFFGNINPDINGFRLRHAFVKLNWSTTELLVGQYWHPMFVTGSYPGTVSFNTGVPFQPFARNPQIRITQNLWRFNFILSAMEQIDFKSTGPNGPNPNYLINSCIPEFNFRYEYKSKALLVGVGVNYKSLMPRLNTTINYVSDDTLYSDDYKTNQRVFGSSFFAYFKHKSKPITIKAYGVYGQMMYSMTMLGGYAETEILQDEFAHLPDSIIGGASSINYSPINTASAWLEIHTNGKKLQVGLFGGYARNLGSNKEIVGSYYSRGSDIAYAYRISPRLIYNAGKFRLAPELEYTVAAYGVKNNKGVVDNYNEVGNFRFLIGVYYFF